MKCYVDFSVVLRFLLAAESFTGTVLENAITDEQLAEALSILSEIIDSLSVFELSAQVRQRAAQALGMHTV